MKSATQSFIAFLVWSTTTPTATFGFTITTRSSSPYSRTTTTTSKTITTQRQQQPPVVCLAAAAKETTPEEKVASIDQPPFEAGTEEELFYALGVNLARQLGDVRPLVESGEELASMAKGLLDTVIGRFSEEGQRGLLKRRGTELNELVTDRAYVV